jgi:hypothetical protein
VSVGFVNGFMPHWSGWRGWQWEGIIIGVLVFGLAFSWTLAGTRLLRVRDDRLIVATIFRRSKLRLADCAFGLQRVGGLKRGSFYQIVVSDGRHTRTVVPWFFPMEWLAQRAVKRLERNLLSDT